MNPLTHIGKSSLSCMGNSFLKNTFSALINRELFAALVVGLSVIGFVSWSHVNKSIQNDVNLRLAYEVETVTTALSNNLNTYGFALAYARSYFDAHRGQEFDFRQFRAFVENLQSQSTTYNILGLNYATRAQVNNLIKFLPNSRKTDILDALTSTTVTLTYPLLPYTADSIHNSDDLSMTLALPYFGETYTPATVQERAAKAKGLIYIPVTFIELFTNILGSPDLNKEHINFSISFIDPDTKKETLAYTRFEKATNDSTIKKIEEFDLHGKRWKISAYAMPGFLSLSDRYLGHIVALATILVIGLLLSFFKQFENTIHHEAKEKSLLEESNRMKSAFLANMSHEIRTPLNAITGYSEILSQTENLNERRNLIESIQKNSSHLTGIIDNILDISNIEFGKSSSIKQRASIRSIFEDILATMKNRAATKHIEFHVKIKNPLPHFFDAAESRIKQIMTNLLGNAVKFTEKGAVTVTFSTETDESGNKYLSVIVSDTGIGISKNNQDNLFQFFSQADASKTRRFGGVGLGLAVSKRLAQQFGGDVMLIESRLGRGSTFQLNIPYGDISDVEWSDDVLLNISPSAEPAETQNLSDLNNKRILIVEDSEDNQDIFKFFLKSAGAVTDLADNGVAAIRKVRENDYDLILMDIQLPQMDGLEATRRLRKEGYSKPIIALTAHASPEEKTNSLDSGCIGLITKPVSQDTLAKQILAILNDSSKDEAVRKVALPHKEIYDGKYVSSR